MNDYEETLFDSAQNDDLQFDHSAFIVFSSFLVFTFCLHRIYKLIFSFKDMIKFSGLV